MFFNYNKHMNNSQSKGSLKWIIIIIVGLILSSYFFDFSVQDAVEDEQTQSNFKYIKNEVSEFYNEHIKEGVAFVWDEFFMELIWENFMSDVDLLQEGETPQAFNAGPTVEISD